MGNRQAQTPPLIPVTQVAPTPANNQPQQNQALRPRPVTGGRTNGQQQPETKFNVYKPSQIDKFFQLSRPQERELALWNFELTVSDVQKLLHPTIKALFLQDMRCTEDALYQITRELRTRTTVEKLTIINVRRVTNTPVFRILTMPYFTQTLKELFFCHIDFDDTIWPKFGRNLKDNRVLELLRGECNMQTNFQGQKNCILMAELYTLKKFTPPVYVGDKALLALGRGIDRGNRSGDTRLETAWLSPYGDAKLHPSWRYFLAALEKASTFKTVECCYFGDRFFKEPVLFWRESLGIFWKPQPLPRERCHSLSRRMR